MPTTSKVSSSSKKKTFSNPATLTKQFKSAERVNLAEDEDEEEPVTTQHSSVKSPIADRRSEDEESSEGSSTGSVRSPIANRRSEKEESSEESSTGSESETDSASGDDEGTNDKDPIRLKETTSTGSQKQAPSKKPVALYKLPPGFEPVTISSQSSSTLADLFSSTSLRTKQLWHIIVPSSVPIKSLGEVSIQSVQNGSAVLTYGGADYGLISEVQDKSAKKILLLPFAQANKYESAEAGISKTFNLQQLVTDRRPGSSAFRADSTSSVIRYGKPVPQQPEGLKMRYRPFGDTESEQSGPEPSSKQPIRPPQFRKPISIENSLSSEKNMNHEESEVGMGGGTKLASKKEERKRHAKSLAAAEPSHTELQKDYIASPKTSKKRKNSPEAETGGTERPVKKNKGKLSLDSVPEAESSLPRLKAGQAETSESSKRSKTPKKHSNAARNGIASPKKSQKKLKAPSEPVVPSETRLDDQKSEAMKPPIKPNSSLKPTPTNGRPEHTTVSLSSAPNRKTDESSQQPDTNEPTTNPPKPKNSNPPRRDHIPPGEPTNPSPEPPPTTAEDLKRHRKDKKRRDRTERSNTIIPPAPNPHPLDITNAIAAPAAAPKTDPDPAAPHRKRRKKSGG